MKRPLFFIDSDTPWRPWESAELGLPRKSIITRCAPFESASYPRDTVEAEYPGFVFAYEALTAVGCDKNLVTDVLKFCIIEATGADLNQFLIDSKTLEKVKTGLTIGLSNEDLVVLLQDNRTGPSAAALPDDLRFH